MKHSHWRRLPVSRETILGKGLYLPGLAPILLYMDTPVDISQLTEGAAVYGIPLAPNQAAALLWYRDLVADWNRRMNLVSRGDLDRFVTYHLLDALKLASVIPMDFVVAVLDFGSGAGIPGIPLSIAFPHLACTFVDSRLKRCKFLKHAVRELRFHSARVVRSRIEDIPEDENGRYDLVCTRATVSLESFFHCCSRFLCPVGALVAIKGPSIDDEISSLKSAVDTDLFHINRHVPPHVEGVRSGTVVVIRRRKVINRKDESCVNV